MDSCTVHIVDLSKDTLSQASQLLCQYRNLDASDEQQLAACREALQRLLQYQHAFCLLACIEDAYVGFLTYSWGFSTSRGLPIMRIQDVFTDPLYRLRGAATSLLLHAQAIAEKEGANRMQLETDLNNAKARPLYEKTGFLWVEQKIVYMYPMNGWHSSTSPTESAR